MLCQKPIDDVVGKASLPSCTLSSPAKRIELVSWHAIILSVRILLFRILSSSDKLLSKIIWLETNPKSNNKLETLIPLIILNAKLYRILQNIRDKNLERDKRIQRGLIFDLHPQ